MATFSNVWITPPSLKMKSCEYSDLRKQLLLTSENSDKANSTKLLKSLHEFHHDRFLEIAFVRSAPKRGLITEQDIRVALPFLDIKKCVTNKSNGSVCVVPTCPETLDPLLHKWDLPLMIDSTEVKIRFSNTEDFLCVCNLPMHITEQQFKTIVEKFGSTERCFLIYDNVTDDHKGYGLVQYRSRAVACQAKTLLHMNCLDSHILYCDWLDHKVVTYAGLYSKCLYVESLSSNFWNLGLLREIFSKYSIPIYCQIGRRSGRTTNFALVEYNTHSAANLTKEKLNGYSIGGSNIQIHFSVPGRSALQLYNSFMIETIQVKQLLLQEAKKGEGLLPTPRMPLLPLPGMPGILDSYALQTSLRNGNSCNTQSLNTIQNGLLNNPLFQHQMPPACLSNVPFYTKFQLPLQSLLNSRQYLITQIQNNMLYQKTTTNKEHTRKSNSKCQNENVANSLQSETSRTEKENVMLIKEQHPARASSLPCILSSLETLKSSCKTVETKRTLLETPRQNVEPFDQNFFANWKQPSTTPTEYIKPALLPKPVEILPTETRTESERRSLTPEVNSFVSAKDTVQIKAEMFTPVKRSTQPTRRPRVVDRWKSGNNGAFLITNSNTVAVETGMKRKTYHLLPTPEISPESGFIGQHSQGIGGHYADTYVKKCKVSHI